MRFILISALLLACSKTPNVSMFDSLTSRSRTSYESSINACKLGSNEDIGVIVNTADALLGTSPGEIWVPCDGPIYTQIVVSDWHTLRFGPGRYIQNVLINGAEAPTMLIKDNVTVTGSGWNTEFVESGIPGVLSHVFIQAYRDSKDHYDRGSENIILKDFKVSGNPDAMGDSIAQVIMLGNSVNVSISNVYIDGTHAMGIGVGGFHATGNVADSVSITNCVFKHVLSQNIAVINAKNLRINSNTFVNGGSTNSSIFFVYIDFEPNIPEDVIENFDVSNNVFDSRGSISYNHGIAIQSQNLNGEFTGPGIISNNTFIGGDYDPVTVTNLMSSAIVLSRVKDVLVTGNNIRRTGQSGIAMYNSTRIQVSNNRLQSVGGGGGGAVTVYSTTYSHILNNNILSPHVVGSSSTGIWEFASSDYNLYTGNIVGKVLETNWYPGPDQSIVLSGSNSRAWNNMVAGVLQ